MQMSSERFTFFWGRSGETSYLSNWYISDFEFKGHVFHSGEQMFMWQKAILFGDKEIAETILQTPVTTFSDNKKIKNLGRMVKNFDEETWSEHREDLIYEGLLEKFRQNESLKSKLLSTGDTIIVEASPYDRVWGIGLSRYDYDALDPSKWRGLNLLGEVLMRVRRTLSES